MAARLKAWVEGGMVRVVSCPKHNVLIQPGLQHGLLHSESSSLAIRPLRLPLYQQYITENQLQ